MNTRNVTRVGLGLALAFLLAAPAAAQQPTAPSKAKTGAAGASIADNKGDISFTYGYMNTSPKGSSSSISYNAGFNFAAAKRVARGVSLVAEFSRYQGANVVDPSPRINQSPAKLYSYVGGVRFSTKSNAMASGKFMMIKPFAEVLYGGANDNATLMNHFSAMYINGGVDLQMSHKFSVRVQGGMPMYFFFGPVQLGYQIQVGLVVPFSKTK